MNDLLTNKTRGLSGFCVDCSEVITSRNNPLIIEIAKLKDKKYRDNENMFIFEGTKLFNEALAAGIELEYVFMTQDNSDVNNNTKLIKCKKIVSNEVYSKISEEKSPQGILCVAKYIDFFHKTVKIYSNVNDSKRKFILSSIRDPGNLGTMIRAASAFKIDELIISSDCADIYNSKTVRSAMGALFRQHITICEDLNQSVTELINQGYKIYAAVLDKNALPIQNIMITDKTCFVIGNEGHGIDKILGDLCGNSVIIPMSECSESLNASIAAAILMWETYRINL